MVAKLNVPRKLVVVEANQFHRCMVNLNEHVPNDVFVNLSAIMSIFAEDVMWDKAPEDSNILRNYIFGADTGSVEYALDLFAENYHDLRFSLKSAMMNQAPWLIKNTYALEELFRLPGSESLLLRVYNHEDKIDTRALRTASHLW